MPHPDSQALLRGHFIRSDDTPVVSKIRVATGVSPLSNLAKLAPVQPWGGAGLIGVIATIPFQHADLHAKGILGHEPKSSRSNSFSASLGGLCAFAVKNSSLTIGDIMVFEQDQWAWGAHLGRAQRARRVRLRRKQPNQSNPTTWRLAAMNMAIRGIDFGKELTDTFTRDQHPDLVMAH